MRLEDMIRMQDLRGYKWEPHVCGAPSAAHGTEPPHTNHTEEYIPPEVPTLKPIKQQPKEKDNMEAAKASQRRVSQ